MIDETSKIVMVLNIYSYEDKAILNLGSFEDVDLGKLLKAG